VGPLRPSALPTLQHATLLIARERATYDYLAARGVLSMLAADFAFLYPYDAVTASPPIAPPYRVVFLRSNNVRADRLRLERRALLEGDRVIADAGADPLILATSDAGRDARFLARAARALGVPWIACRSVAELTGLIAGASAVVSDRYHPAICAAVLGRPVRVIPNREPHKMSGLQALLAGRGIDEWQALARAGLRTVQETLQASA
jgi:polysaccharide pyruvyl transferase WcaK-like protein